MRGARAQNGYRGGDGERAGQRTPLSVPGAGWAHGISHAEGTEPEGREGRKTSVHKAIYPTAMHGCKNANTLRKATREAAA